MRRGARVGLFALLLACTTEPTVAPADERRDVERLQAAMTEDPAQLVLEEIDEAIAADRPVMAADLIERSAIPAVRHHIELVRGTEVRTTAGRTLRSEAGRLLRHRLTALEHWRDALARGINQEDEALVQAIHENALAEHDLFEFHRALAAIRPLETGPGAESRASPLEGLPQIAPPAPPSDDDPEAPPPEPDPHAADPIDGREELDEPELPPIDDHHAIVPR